MPRRTSIAKQEEPRNVQTLTDFVLFSQRSCILRLSANLNRDKVSYPQFFLLAYLAEEDCISMSNIAKMMGHSTAAATGMVDKLQELGYISRSTAAADRRKIMVRITKAGMALVERMRANIARDLAAIMSENQVGTEETVAAAASAIRRVRRPVA